MKEFSSVQAISHSNEKTSNPWLQITRSLKLISESSRELVKKEKSRSEEAKSAWKHEMDLKSSVYSDMGDSQNWWSKAGVGITFLTTVLPMMIGKDRMPKDLMSIVEKVSSVGTTGCQEAAKIDNFYKQDRLNQSEWSSESWKKNLENEQADLQAAQQSERELKERSLEIIRTMTQQVLGR